LQVPAFARVASGAGRHTISKGSFPAWPSSTSRSRQAAAPAEKTAKPAAKARKEAGKPKPPAASKKPTPKLERDSFRMTGAEFDGLRKLKERAKSLGVPAKKSEILRADLRILHRMDDEHFAVLLAQVQAP
jgi:hypothetical protein